MRPHQKLEAWSYAIDLVTDVYKGTEHFPKEERYGLTGQIRRAAVSIPANLAEGAGRRSQKEFAHFLSNSQGSASELETELIIAHRLGYLDESYLCKAHRPTRKNWTANYWTDSPRERWPTFH
jgi:four helix bundle protein